MTRISRILGFCALYVQNLAGQQVIEHQGKEDTPHSWRGLYLDLFHTTNKKPKIECL